MSHRRWGVAALLVVGAAGIVSIARHPSQPVSAQQATINGIPNQTITLDSGAVMNLTTFIQGIANGMGFAQASAVPTNTSQLANGSGYVNATQAAAAAPVQSVNAQTGAVVLNIPTKLSQLTNDAGFVGFGMPITGTLTVPTTLLSLGTSVTPVANAGVPAGAFYLCAFNTTNTTAQTNIDVSANVMTAGSLNVVLRNTSATTLTGGYTINYKCIPY